MYSIIRYFKDRECVTIKTKLTLEEAQEHCSSTETSSETCLSDEGSELTFRCGPWFDGYIEEKGGICIFILQ